MDLARQGGAQFQKVRVVVVDDSAVIRAVLKEILESYNRIEVVATAVDAHRHRPSVDVLFDSVASVDCSNASGVLLTVMGSDGAQGLLAMRLAGAITAAQDEASSVVWGMPGSAVKIDAACKVLPLQKVAAFILQDAFV